MTKNLIATGFAVVVLAGLAGCAQTPRPGEVVMKASTTEAHVAFSARDVAAGDRVGIYRDVHTGRHGRTQKRFVGDGTVTRLMGDQYAVVEVPAGVDFQQGDYAERK